jgi:hypothetical protein
LAANFVIAFEDRQRVSSARYPRFEEIRRFSDFKAILGSGNSQVAVWVAVYSTRARSKCDAIIM